MLGGEELKTTYGNGKDVIKQINQYRKICLLGEGSFSKVFLAVNMNDGKHYAIKRIALKSFKRSFAGIHQLEKEIEIMRIIQSPYFMKLHEVIHVEEKGIVYLVLDYADCGNLDRAIECRFQFHPKEIKCMFRQMAEGVKYLHDNNIVHQDLKPANVLLNSKGQVFISDFGIGRSFQSAAMVVGTPAYQSPEVVDDSCENEEEDIDPCKEDVWSLGITLYQLSFQKLPFSGCNVYEIVRAIETTVLEKPEGADNELWDLLQKMLVVSPSKRYSIEEVLSHPYTRSANLNDQPRCSSFKIPEIDPSISVNQINGIVCGPKYSFESVDYSPKFALPKFSAPFQ